MKKGLFIALLAAGLMFSSGCSRNVDEVKQHSEQVFENNGFKIIGYQGYKLSLIFGGIVWYTIKKSNDNGITYDAGIAKWGDEYHLYNLKAIDAISPK
jgi:hypothetical protein